MGLQSEPTVRIGVDVGGTFTDLVLVAPESGAVEYLKLRSTHPDPSEAVLGGTRELLASAGRTPQDVAYFAHGTTVATNILLEHRGARTGLILTKGFRDLFELARQKRSHLYDLLVDKPVALVPRDLARTVDERVSFEGEILRGLDAEDARRVVAELIGDGVEAIAVCLLHSYANPRHEEQVGELIRSLAPEIFVSTSSQVLREFREYERTSTTVINGYVGPATSRYLNRIASGLRDDGVNVTAKVSRSDGGVMSIEAAAQQPVTAIASGPAAGVAGALFVAALDGYSNLLTMDIGGTSVDTCLVRDGTPRMAAQSVVAGLPVKLPMLDVHSVGAGGGSIARVQEGLLKVGPSSAGSDPGPASYGAGGQEPTVTDAQLVLGRLGETRSLGDRLRLSPELAARALERRVAQPLGLSTVDAAYGVVAVMEANLVRALRRVSVEAGHDPRDFVMVAYGGAGPLHAVSVARELGMTEALIPARPGLLCAIGLLATDIRTSFSRTQILSASDPDAGLRLADVGAELEGMAQAWLQHEGIPPAGRRIDAGADMRYEGQNHELTVAVDSLAAPDAIAQLVERFHDEHEHQFGHADRSQAVQIVTIRMFARGKTAPLSLPAPPVGEADAGPIGERPVYFHESGGFELTPVYRRERLPGSVSGPAIIEQMDSTIVVPPGVSAVSSASGNLRLQW